MGFPEDLGLGVEDEKSKPNGEEAFLLIAYQTSHGIRVESGKPIKGDDFALESEIFTVVKDESKIIPAILRFKFHGYYHYYAAVEMEFVDPFYPCERDSSKYKWFKRDGNSIVKIQNSPFNWAK